MMWQRIRHGVRWIPRERFALAARAVDMKDVKSVLISLDPFHPGNQSLRSFWHVIASPRVKMTGNFKIKTEIRNDRQPPFFVADLVDGKRLIFKTDRMPEADLIMQFNELLGNPRFGKCGPMPRKT
uniref:L51_S25_CI-B8 domain-containing protein n=1 Tax=Syphacia muris TaxID=451379 RepID=A0A0N5AMD8_9BILA